jgi:cell division protein FtsL
MEIKEFDYVRGNTAIKPQRKSSEKDRKKYEELKRSKKNRNKRLQEQQKNMRSAMLQIATAILIVGTVIISRDVKVYSIQNNISGIKSEIKNITAENEAIKVDLLKFSSLDNIKTNAEEKLGMVVATKDNLVEIDMSGDYFQELNAQEEISKNNEEKGLFSKMMDALN